MNWDQIKGNWKHFKGTARERWGRLTDDEVDQAAGEREKLEGLVQRKYGKTKEEARREVDGWIADQN
ncbi:CsbD family protein [Palleronia sediminis]|uniref:CsbD family protein n=1 Tax=Palleronia sediminis TaxID=2547833 RepID=A0A4R5ZYK7_9RHOB|nr:CsbD family protein [Palleronia sediminis]TDL75097.1 CsbD family protein [Palleronia sediminis]